MIQIDFLFSRLDTGHSYTMDISQTNRVWDYVGDNFVHRLLQTDGADGKLVAAEGVNCKTNSGCTGGTCVHGEEKMKSLELVITSFCTFICYSQLKRYKVSV